MKINFLNKNQQSNVTSTFRLPFNEQKKVVTEPTLHKNGIVKLTKASFSYTHNVVDQYFKHFIGKKNITFLTSKQVDVRMTFDDHAHGLTKVFDRSNLTIEY
jgi:hypothetical protein